MQDQFILYKKNIQLQRGREFIQQIPFSVNTNQDSFILEVSKEDLKENLVIELLLTDPQSKVGEPTRIAVSLDRPLIQLSLNDSLKDPAAHYLFLGCRSNHAVTLSLSVVAK